MTLDDFVTGVCSMILVSTISCLVTRHLDENEFIPVVKAAYNAGLRDAPSAVTKSSCTPAQAAIWWTGGNLRSAKKKLCKRSTT